MEEAQIAQSIIKSNNLKLDYNSQHDLKDLELIYLGTGGFYVRYKESSALFDPFFSHHSFLSLPFKKVAPIPENIEQGLNQADLSQTKHIFISHSHYDHLLDAPYVLTEKLGEDARLYGSSATQVLLKNALDSTRIVDMTEAAKNPLDDSDGYSWIKVSDNIRVLPVLADHAPHFKLVFPISLYNKKPKPIPGYNSTSDKTKASKWQRGCTFSFLIDIMEGDQVIFRLFLQSSAADSPYVRPPQEVLDERKVDLAMLGGASFGYTAQKEYPDYLINALAPQRVLVCHWEDFFRPFAEENPRFVRFTNFKRFLLKLNESYPLDVSIKDRYFLPRPGCKITFNSN